MSDNHRDITLFGCVWLTRRTEGYHKFCGVTVYQWWGCVKSKTVVRWTRILKHLWVYVRLALSWASILISTTKFVKIKSQASTFASHHVPICVQDLKLLWAQAVHIFRAPFNGTISWQLLCWHENRDVVPINQAYIIKTWLPLIFLCWNFHKCRWGSAYKSLARQPSITVPCFTSRIRIRIEIAARSRPNPATPC